MAQFIDVLIQLLTFGVVALGSYAALEALETALDVRRRLATGDAAEMAPSPLIRGEGLRNPFLRWVQASTSISDTAQRSRLRRELALAGFDHPAAPAWYVIVRFAAAIGLPLALMFGQLFSAKPLNGFPLIFFALLLCAVGLLVPRVVIQYRARVRREQLEHEFPDALDLMVICVEAGLGLEAAFIRVGQETEISHARISRELNRTSDELRAGQTRAEALRHLAERSDVDSVRSFVALLIQTDVLGVSIGQTLRTYSTEMRQKRFLVAEEKAMRIPVLMTIPLVTCILPVIMTAVLLPPTLDVIRTLIPMLTHRSH